MTGGIVFSTALLTAGVAVGVDLSRLAGAALLGAIVIGSVHAGTEIRDLRKGLETAGTGPLPLLETLPRGPARPEKRSLRSVGWDILVVLLVAAFVAYVVFEFKETVTILLGVTAGLAVGGAIVLGWLRLRRKRDGMQLYVRDVEGDEAAADPPKYHLLPRGS